MRELKRCPLSSFTVRDRGNLCRIVAKYPNITTFTEQNMHVVNFTKLGFRAKLPFRNIWCSPAVVT